MFTILANLIVVHSVPPNRLTLSKPAPFKALALADMLLLASRIRSLQTLDTDDSSPSSDRESSDTSSTADSCEENVLYTILVKRLLVLSISIDFFRLSSPRGETPFSEGVGLPDESIRLLSSSTLSMSSDGQYRKHASRIAMSS